MAKLTKDQIKEIASKYKEGAVGQCKKLAAEYKVTSPRISQIFRQYVYPDKPIQHRAPKLTAEQAAETFTNTTDLDKLLELEEAFETEEGTVSEHFAGRV
jgi:hypothetical protein